MSRTLFAVALLVAVVPTVNTSSADVPVSSEAACVLDQPISSGLSEAADAMLANSAGTVRDTARAAGVLGNCTDNAPVTPPANPPGDAAASSFLAQFAASALTVTASSTSRQASIVGSRAAATPVGGVAAGGGGTSQPRRRLPDVHLGGGTPAFCAICPATGR